MTFLTVKIVRQLITKSSDVSKQTSVFQHGSYQICYKRYASLYFIVGFDNDENELSILEWIHCFVESLDSMFSNVCELDILFNSDTVNNVLEDMIYNGQFVENNRGKNLERTFMTNKFADRSTT